MKSTRARPESHPEFKLKAERKPHPGSVWLRALTYCSRWYIRVRLGDQVVVRVAGGAQSHDGAMEFLGCFKAEFARTGRIPSSKREPRTKTGIEAPPPGSCNDQPLLIP